MFADRIQEKRGKSEKLVERLMALAHRLGPGAKFPTVREMCARYDVAIVTLTGALAMLEARGAITRTHGHGIYVSEQINRKSIALVLGHDIFETGLPPFYALFIQACRRTLRSLGYHVFYFADIPEASSAGSPFPVREDLSDAIRDNLLHGLILAPQTSANQIARFRAADIPVVAMSCSGEPATIAIDYHAIIEEGVEMLAAAGCKRIALVSPFDYQAETGAKNPRRQDRCVFNQVVNQFGMSSQEHWFLSNHPAGDGNGPFFRLGSHSAETLLGDTGHKTRPDGIVVLDESVAAGLLPTVQTMGLGLGRDVHVATHANRGVELLNPYIPAIHRIQIDQDVVFNATFRMLDAVMTHPATAPEPVLIPPTSMGETPTHTWPTSGWEIQ